jgi:threonine dehydrogenase-like Zn-dependent dehydrogenase
MKAAVLAGPTRARIDRIDVPEPGEGAVRVRLEGCGVCGSNLAPWEGRPWFNYPFVPGQPGHEGWGEIDAVGPKVTKFKKGERVAMLSYNAFAEFDIAKENSAVALPDSLKKKPFPGEALGCAMNVFRRCEIKPTQTVAIVGVGFLGAILTSLAVKAGAFVIAISRRPFALEAAKQFGAGQTIELSDPQKVSKRVQVMTEGTGCDCVIEAVGNQTTLDLAGELTRERGRLVIAGYHQDGPRTVNMQLWNWRGIDVINAHERDPKIYLDGMKAAVEAVSSGALDPSPLYTHQFSLDGIADAFTSMQARPKSFLKGLVTL